MKKEQKITLLLFIIYIIMLTWIILFKFQFSFSALRRIRSINLIPFAGSVIINGRIYFEEIINNFIVFVPVGVYTGMLKTEWPLIKKIVPVFGISFAYEILQFILAIGVTDITDLISNTAGGIAGILIVGVLSGIFKDKVIKILNILAMLCTVFVAGFLILLIVYNYL